MKNPMLAAKKPPTWSDERWIEHICSFLPVYVQPKYDGIRCLIREDGIPVSRSLKMIRNDFVVDSLIASNYPKGSDGELITLTGSKFDSFNEVSSKIMSAKGKPIFVYKVFDNCFRTFGAPRRGEVDGQLDEVDHIGYHSLAYEQTVLCSTKEELLKELENNELAGYEGSIIRLSGSPYKEGRVTINEMYLAAVKLFEDGEATIIGFEEKMSNQNPSTLSLTGYAERSSHSANQIPEDTLGALIVTCNSFKEPFKLGTGFTDTQRKEMWDKQDFYKGHLVKFKYQATRTTKDKPIHPVFLGFRDKEDL